MAFSIHFDLSGKPPLPKPANRNWHDPFYWEFAYDLAHRRRVECEATEADWNTPKVIHDLYEIYNAPHVTLEQRRSQAVDYLFNKQMTLIEQGKARHPDHIKDYFAKRRKEKEEAAKAKAEEDAITEASVTAVSWKDLLD